MDPNTTSAIRDIFVTVAASAFAVLCIVITVIAVKLYRPLRDTVHNAASTSRNLTKVSSDLAAVSQDTASNVAQTSRNAVEISENLKEGSAEVAETVRNAGEAAKNVSEAASQVSSIAETVRRFTSLGVSGGGSSTGAGSILRLLRTVFGGSSRRGDGNTQQGT